MNIGGRPAAGPVVPGVKPKTAIENIVEALGQAEKRLRDSSNSRERDLDRLIDNGAFPDPAEHNSPLGKELEAFFDNNSSSDRELLCVEFLDALRAGRDAKKLTTYDLKKLLPKIFEKNFMSRFLVKRIYALYSQGGSFAHVLRDSANFSSGGSAVGHANLMTLINDLTSGSCSGLSVLSP